MTSNTEGPDFFSLLKDKELCPVFEEWLKDDFSYENYRFWRDVESFKQIEDQDDMKEKAQELYDLYFQLGSEWEVNADHYQKIELKENMKNPTREVFDDIQISIFVLMRMDSYPKFMESERYFKAAGLPLPSSTGMHTLSGGSGTINDDKSDTDAPPRKKSGFFSCLSAD
mmetsp:Transcript_17378/g.25853  ORF Transcript_17378/g.25853 Transcript_17378/m.25853 type:complete len:170 (-) Transcript_17378:130-639(-)|eukprot:CAMPEP_0201553454 /NCGR_PEP_ID=MMETSP0173_2-20130828/28759_1 /ASSEMBLY_ACC=CAM_ASM_000268 /TAXON_ID=218659 /ORGANISM="Vexillifera sp., Strain DIVA3 564/2" /LENGTH=169 /DNA_ID=CAMNT_0047964255 /DNA_START=46 /DNA_END=555 /DNA_ORIENTATION=-